MTIRVGSYFESQSSGSATNNSSGTITVATNFTNASAFTNNGRIYQTSAAGTFLQQNGATFTNAGYIEVAGNFTNQGNINGAASAPSGAVRVAGVSTNSGFNFGGSGLLDFCDTTPGTADKGFNSNTGGVGVSVTTCAVAARPLPVELLRFSATAANGRAVLSWATASEKNSAYFAVERSADGRAFAAIAKVAAQGTSTALTTYTATDEQPRPGLSYYRLRQVDADGTTAFSPVVTVQLKGAAADFTLTPNPATEQVLVDLTAWPAQASTIEVLNLSGQVLLSQPALGGSAQPLGVRAIPAGAYLLRVRNAAGQQTVRRLLKL